MEELIYIIIGIAWVAYSFYKKNLKNNQANTPKVSPVETNYDKSNTTKEDDEYVIDDFFSNFFKEDRLESETNFSEDSTLNQQESTIFDYSDDEKTPTKKDFSEEGRSSIRSITHDEDDIYDEDVEEDLYENFDLRKAVIYSEYLNRKYF